MNKKVLKANTFLFSLFCVYNKLRDTDKKIKTKKTSVYSSTVSLCAITRVQLHHHVIILIHNLLMKNCSVYVSRDLTFS